MCHKLNILSKYSRHVKEFVRFCGMCSDKEAFRGWGATYRRVDRVLDDLASPFLVHRACSDGESIWQRDRWIPRVDQSVLPLQPGAAVVCGHASENEHRHRVATLVLFLDQVCSSVPELLLQFFDARIPSLEQTSGNSPECVCVSVCVECVWV